jgi:hypothetical protein
LSDLSKAKPTADRGIGTPSASRHFLGPLLVSVLLAVAHYMIFWGFTIDDAAITFAYAKSFVAGHGLGTPYAGGYRVEGYSNTLWLLLLAACRKLGVREELAAKCLGLAAATLCIVCVFLLLRRFLQDRRILWAAALLPCSLTFTFWSASGLENALYGALLAAACLAIISEDLAVELPWRSAVLLWLTFLTRPDGLAFAGASFFYKLVRLQSTRRIRSPEERGRQLRHIGAWLAIIVTLCGAVFVWRHWYFGFYWPNTVYAKSAASPAGSTLLRFVDPTSDGWRYVVNDLLLHKSVVLLPFALVGAIGVRRGAGVALPLMCAASLALPLYRPDWMEHYRFMYVFELFLIPLALLGLDTLLDKFHSRQARWAVLGASVAAAFAFVGANIELSVDETTRPHQHVDRQQIVAAYTPKKAHAAELGLQDPLYFCPDLGGTTYQLDMRILDLGGLADVHLAHAHGDPALFEQYVFQEQRPDFVFMHPPYDFFRLSSYLVTDYLPVSREGERDIDYVRADLIMEALGESQKLMRGNGVELERVIAPTGGLPRALLPVHLFWRSTGGGFGNAKTRIRLLDASGHVVSELVQPTGYAWFPNSSWPHDVDVREYASILLPSTEGQYDLSVDLLDETLKPILGAHYQRSMSVGTGAAVDSVKMSLSMARQAFRSDQVQVVLRWLSLALASLPGRPEVQQDIDRIHADWDTQLLAEVKRLLLTDDIRLVAATLRRAAKVRGRRTTGEEWKALGRRLRELGDQATRAGDVERAYLFQLAASEANHEDGQAESALEQARRKFLEPPLK